jgi:uncharacterized protein DUF4186
MARSKRKLNISCTDSDCGNGLHCFKATEEMVAQNNVGVCRECGVQLVDWERVHCRNTRDVENTFAMLKLEKVRHFFWHVPINQHAMNHARRKGRKGLRERVRKHLSTAIGPANPWHDGIQTPMEMEAPNAIPYGQHATATCCRKCVEYWHGIPRGKIICEQDLIYLAELVCRFLEERIPNLTEEGERIPPIRSRR